MPVVRLPSSVQVFRPTNTEVSRIQDNIVAAVNPILSFLNGAFRQATSTPTLNYAATTATASVPGRTVFGLMGPALVGSGTTAGITMGFTTVQVSAGNNSGQNATLWVQPWSGSIVGVTHNIVGNQSAISNFIPTTGGVVQGTAQAIVLKNNVTTGAVATLSTAAPVQAIATFPSGTYTFNAGDYLSFGVVATGSCARTFNTQIGANTLMQVWVQYNAV